MMKCNLLSISLFFMTIALGAQNSIKIDPESAIDESFFKFIPTVNYNGLIEQSGITTFTTDYSPSGSFWLDPTPADEERVFLAKLKHEASAEENSWELRIGKGGQIYSFKSAYGEGVPPQSKENSTWVDEVWQPVSVALSLNNRDFTSRFYFIHGAGAYNNGEVEDTWYSPLVASYYNDNEKAYYVSNWGTQAHIPSLYKSETLYTTKYKEIGEGILEVTYIIQNFGDETLSHINAPWGGVRSSSLRSKFVSFPDGSIELTEAQTGSETGAISRDIDETGGYIIWSQDEVNSSAASLGIVFGNDIKTDKLSSHGLRNVFFRLGQVGGDSNPRDYTLFTTIAQININRGETFYYRTYYINGTRDFVQEKANLLASYSDYGFIEPATEETPLVSISVDDFNGGLTQGFSLFTSFNDETLPIFLMKNTITGETYISPDLYYNVTTAPLVNPYPIDHAEYEEFQNRFTYKPYQSNIEYVRLLGYAYNKDMSNDDSFALLDNLILDDTKVVLTDEYANKIWVKLLKNTGNNLALKGKARQSSTAFKGDAEKAIDDNVNGAFSKDSVTHTENEINAYWQVTLDGIYTIGDIIIYGRTDDCCIERLSNFTVLVYNESTRNFFEVVRNYPDPSVTVNAGGAFGNIIRIRSNTGQALSLAEVQIFEATNQTSNKDTDEVLSVTSNVKLYPNPIASTTTIQNAANSVLNVFDMKGSTVFTQHISSDSETINLNSLPAGIYYGEVVHETSISIVKLIKY